MVPLAPHRGSVAEPMAPGLQTRKARYGTKQREVKCNRETQKTRDAGG